MVKILKVINNNVLIILDSKLREYVVFGKGIGFQMKPGMMIDEAVVEKKYINAADEDNYTVKLLEETPYEVIEVCDQIKELVEENYDLEYTNYAYFSLVDHINNSIYRRRINANLGTTLSTDELALYKKELDLAQKAVELINNQLTVELYEAEIVYMTLHFISYIYDTQLIQLNEKVLRITNEIIEIIRYDFMQEIEENFNLHRFIVHLKFFILRNLQKHSNNQSGSNEQIHQLLKNDYIQAEQTVNKICNYLIKEYDFVITNDERFYLLIHLSKLSKNN